MGTLRFYLSGSYALVMCVLYDGVNHALINRKIRSDRVERDFLSAHWDVGKDLWKEDTASHDFAS